MKRILISKGAAINYVLVFALLSTYMVNRHISGILSRGAKVVRSFVRDAAKSGKERRKGFPFWTIKTELARSPCLIQTNWSLRRARQGPQKLRLARMVAHTYNACGQNHRPTNLFRLKSSSHMFDRKVAWISHLHPQSEIGCDRMHGTFWWSIPNIMS